MKLKTDARKEGESRNSGWGRYLAAGALIAAACGSGSPNNLPLGGDGKASDAKVAMDAGRDGAKVDSKSDAVADARAADMGKGDLLKADLMKPDSKTSCAAGQNTTFSGLIYAGSYQSIAGYDVHYAGMNAGGQALFDIKCGSFAVLSNQACTEDVVTTLSATSEGKKFIVTPHTVRADKVDVSVKVSNI